MIEVTSGRRRPTRDPTVGRPGARRSRPWIPCADRPGAPGSAAARWGVAAVEAAIGYEWLLSALNKLLNPGFRLDLARTLEAAQPGNPNRWYVALLHQFVIPHAQAAALLTESGEGLVALGCLVGAVLWLRGGPAHGRWARLPHCAVLLVLLVLLGGAVMTANYYLLAGNTWPGLNPRAPFNEGLSLDGLLTLIAVALAAVHGGAVHGAAAPARPRQNIERGTRVRTRSALDMSAEGTDRWHHRQRLRP